VREIRAVRNGGCVLSTPTTGPVNRCCGGGALPYPAGAAFCFGEDYTGPVLYGEVAPREQNRPAAAQPEHDSPTDGHSRSARVR
jgi:hypothetical protein